MEKNDIERWAWTIIRRVEKKHPSEDFTVELKTIWPTDAKKVARQIAAHANAALGNELLWLIGVDEASGVTGADFAELSNWWTQVKSEFDGATPDIIPLNIDINGRTIVALDRKSVV